ncbi:hypothetical protein ACLM5H_04000 [Fredinandcohnia humi]
MDDKIFEQRLLKVKDSYEQMPSVTNSEAIMKKIKESEQPITKTRSFYLPYVASFIGVLVVAGILATQLIFQSTQNTEGQKETPTVEQQVSAEFIEQKSKELEEFYQAKLGELKKELDFEGVENYRFVSEAKVMVQNFKESSPEIYASEKNLVIRFEETRNFIERKLMTPKQEMNAITNNAKAKAGKDVSTTNEEVIAIIEKQEELLPLFQDRWNAFYNQYGNQLKDQQGDLLAKFMGYKEFQGTDVSKFAEDVIKNGYYVVGIGEFPEVAINYTNSSGYDGLSSIPGISKAMQNYLDIKSTEELVTDGAWAGSWDELGDYIVQIEMFIEEYQDFVRREDLYQLYVRYFNYYMNNYLPNSRIYVDENLKQDVKKSYERLFTTYPETKTAAAIEHYYNLLKNNQFKQVDVPASIPNLVEETSGESGEPKVTKIEGVSLELTNELLSIYEEYKQKQYDTLLFGLRPFDVMRIYMHASDRGDTDTTYALYYEAEDAPLPLKDKYIKDRRKNTNFSQLNKTLTYVEENKFEDSAVIYLYTEEEPRHFTLAKQNGVWKVSYMPMQ